VLVNTGPRLTATDDFPFGVPATDWRPDLDGIVELWGNGGGGEQHITATATDPWWRMWYARSRRQQVSPHDGLALMRMIGGLDVRHIVAAVQAPTLILHRTGNAWWPVEGARWLVDRIDDSRLVELDGADNYWWAGDADRIVDEVEHFLLGSHTSRPSHRELVTIMFTDIVDSTATASRLGDAGWRAVLDGHDSITISEAERHGGIPVKHLGDGYLIQFDGPAAAIRAAIDIRDTTRRHELDLRIAIHTGEVERRGDDISGVAVHLASRMLDTVEPGEIVVSGVVRGLVAGSGIAFEPRGTQDFKGLPDRWDLHAVVAAGG
jgi:class 3 adenylate cyclase